MAQPLPPAAMPKPCKSQLLRALSCDELETLERLISNARLHQQKQLHRAFESALAHIPTLLRAPVRKILFP